MRTGRPRVPLSIRFWSRVERGDPDECWTWTGTRNYDGYGRISPGGGNRAGVHAIMAHRYAYEALVGPIPAGLTIDHLCRQVDCVNPKHMEPVTIQENIRR